MCLHLNAVIHEMQVFIDKLDVLDIFFDALSSLSLTLVSAESLRHIQITDQTCHVKRHYMSLLGRDCCVVQG